MIGNDHPETFAGPLDNWHIHYNLCRGNAQGRDTFIPKSECEAAGGNFSAALGWMIHAWVDPLHDNQLGVFAMWNSSIQPVMDAATILETRKSRGSDFPEGAEQSLITDFLYNGDLAVNVGQPLFFNNVGIGCRTPSPPAAPADPAYSTSSTRASSRPAAISPSRSTRRVSTRCSAPCIPTWSPT